jgi:hypothetical protein
VSLLGPKGVTIDLGLELVPALLQVSRRYIKDVLMIPRRTDRTQSWASFRSRSSHQKAPWDLCVVAIDDSDVANLRFLCVRMIICQDLVEETNPEEGPLLKCFLLL